jgi:Xaa-Pro aminopeptidase
MRTFALPSDAPLIREKQDQAIAAMDRLDIDAWLVFVREGGDSHTVQTIAGPEVVVQNAVLILTRDNRRFAILEPIDIRNGTGEHFDEIVRYQLDIAPALRQVWESIAPRRVAINYSREQFAADGLTHGMFLRLQDALGEPFDRAAISSEELVVAVRAVKSGTELARLRRAADITARIIDEAGKLIRPGVTDSELGAYVARRAGELGAEQGGASIAVNGVGKSIKGPLGKPVEAGEVVLFDMEVRFEGYYSDMKYLWYVRDHAHPLPDMLVRQWKACRESADFALTRLKPGAWAHEVHHAAWEVVEKHGFRRDPHAYGHQIGRQIHDAGVWLGDLENLYRPARGQIAADMVFSLDPTINRQEADPAWWSMGVEDMARVTPDGGELLNRPQREIDVIDW